MANDERLKIMTAQRGWVEAGSQKLLPEILENLFHPMEKEFFDEYAGRELKFDKSFWYDSIQTAIWREKDTVGGLYCTIKGGHNKELHNHNDVGHFTIFNDCEPVIIDPGMGVYSNKAFSDERYSIWFFNSKYHNVPYIGGIEQKDDDTKFGAIVLDRTDDSVKIDIAPAYDNESILHWIRSMKYSHETGEYFVDEEYEFTEEKDIDLHFILVKEPDIKENKILLSGGLEILYSDMEAACEEIDLNDKLMEKYWGSLYRLKLSTKGKKGKISYIIKKQEVK